MTAKDTPFRDHRRDLHLRRVDRFLLVVVPSDARNVRELGQMIGDMDNTMRILSSILDMAHGVLPDDDFAITMVIRSKHPEVPAHFLIGDDEEPVVAETLREIGKGPVIIGEASQDKAEPQARFGAVHMEVTDPKPEEDA